MRDATFEDYPRITDLLVGLGVAMPSGEAAVRAHWERLWRDNPAIAVHGPGFSRGWVLEDGGRMVGFVGNIPMVSYYGDQPVLVSTSRAWGVEKDYRPQAGGLVAAYFEQPNADLLLISSANYPAGQRCLRHGGSALPQTDYDRVLYWVLDAGGFLTAAFRKKGLPATAAAAAAFAAAPGLATATALGRRRPAGRGFDVDRLRIGDLGGEFDDLWHRKKAEGRRLLACRDAATLRWYYTPLTEERDTVVLGARGGGRLQGYAVAVNEDAPAIGLRRLKLADLFIAGDDSHVLDRLLAAAADYGREAGYHVLEVVGLPANLRRMVHASRPLVRAMPTFPFFFKAMTPELAEACAREETWYVTSYDGDTSLA